LVEHRFGYNEGMTSSSAARSTSKAPVEPLRVVLVDDHRILREGLRVLLEGSRLEDGRRLVVVGEASEGVRALDLCRDLAPDVAVLDVSLPGISGLEVARRVRTFARPPAVVMLSMHVSPEHIRHAREAGAAAYVVKGSGVAELAEAIGSVAKGALGPFPTLSADGPSLTERERQVLSAIARGLSNREIAQTLEISVHTVNTHRVHLMEKLDVHDVASLTRLALSLGLAS
jgi:DNA-binding NarL/FixJ family response regulator